MLCQHSLLCRDIFEWIMEKQQFFLIKVSGGTAIVLLLLSSSIMELLLTMSGYIIFFPVNFLEFNQSWLSEVSSQFAAHRTTSSLYASSDQVESVVLFTHFVRYTFFISTFYESIFFLSLFNALCWSFIHSLIDSLQPTFLTLKHLVHKSFSSFNKLIKRSFFHRRKPASNVVFCILLALLTCISITTFAMNAALFHWNWTILPGVPPPFSEIQADCCGVILTKLSWVIKGPRHCIILPVPTSLCWPRICFFQYIFH